MDVKLFGMLKSQQTRPASSSSFEIALVKGKEMVLMVVLFLHSGLTFSNLFLDGHNNGEASPGLCGLSMNSLIAGNLQRKVPPPSPSTDQV